MEAWATPRSKETDLRSEGTIRRLYILLLHSNKNTFSLSLLLFYPFIRLYSFYYIVIKILNNNNNNNYFPHLLIHRFIF